MATTNKVKTTKSAPKALKTGKTLANKHRPKTWDDVCGHTTAVSRLKGMIAKRDIPNAILLIGPSGTGKTTLARVFSRYLNCETNESCGKCESCLAMDERRHPDYQEENCGADGKIDDIRSIITQANFMPTLGNLRVIVLDEAQAITGAAQNALLKTLEEPPANTLFILCSMEPEKVHAAIKGRSQVIELKRVQAEYVAEHLEGIAKSEGIENLSKEAFILIAESTGGQLRDALQTLDAVNQVVSGQEEELEGEELDELIRSTVVDAAGISDDNVASKVLLYLHAGTIKGKSTVRAMLKTLLDVQGAVSFANSLLWQNSYLLSITVDPKNPAIYHTATNRNLVKLLNEHVEGKEDYGNKPNLSRVLTIHNRLIELRTRLVQLSGQDMALMQTILATVYSDLAE